MTKLIKFTLFLSFIFFVSCTSDNFITETELNGFTAQDIEVMEALKMNIQDQASAIKDSAQSYMKKNRHKITTMAISKNEVPSVQQMEKIGAASIQTLAIVGLPPSELDDLLPIEGNEAIYGMLAVEILNAWDPQDITLVNGEYQIKVDWEKAGSCLESALGIDLFKDVLWGGIAIWQTVKNGGGHVSKKVLLDTIKGVITSAGRKAGKEALGQIAKYGTGAWVAVTTISWANCYFGD